MPRYSLILAAALVATAALAAAPRITRAAPPEALVEQTVSIGGVERRYLVQLPAARPRALVIVLHGGGGTARHAATRSPLSHFRALAEREGIALVFPDSLRGNWNDCRRDGPALPDSDDVAFLDAVIARVAAQAGLGPAQTFVAGHSNGALMAFRYAFERAERIAGIATVAGQLPAAPEPGRCTTGPSRPVPVLMTMGTADAMMPYAGGCVAGSLLCRRGEVLSATDTRDRWLALNRVARAAAEVAPIDLDRSDGGPAVAHRYRGAAPVHWWRLEGAGHRVPSRALLQPPDSGPQNRDVEFAEIAWAFFDERLN
jgi:polyhydroxybutyrate depolymerase